MFADVCAAAWAICNVCFSEFRFIISQRAFEVAHFAVDFMGSHVLKYPEIVISRGI